MTTFAAELTTKITTTGPEATRLTMTIDRVYGFVDLGLFVFQIDTVTLAPKYSHVASPFDLQNYAVNSPGNTWFQRSASLDLYFLTATEAEAAAATIDGNISRLCHDMEVLSVQATGTTTTITA